MLILQNIIHLINFILRKILITYIEIRKAGISDECHLINAVCIMQYLIPF